VTGLGEEGKMGQLELPFLIAHGTKDRVTNIEGSRKLWLESRTREEDKIICLYEGFEHIRESLFFSSRAREE
jgi:alpha-beta hydrolase superfamily lysophospholipase